MSTSPTLRCLSLCASGSIRRSPVAGNNFAGHGDIIGIGLKHDANEELDPGAWRFRLQGSRFRWRKHCDARYAGFRLIESADALRAHPVEETAERLCVTVTQQLERSNALQRPGRGTA